MITSLIIGAISGFLLSLVPGPVGVSIIKTGIIQGRRPGAYMALGTALMDAFYALITVFATTAVFQAAISYTDNHPRIVLFFQLCVVLLFLVLGILNIRSSRKKGEDLSLPKTDNKFVSRFKKRGPFVIGLAMAITCIASPTFFPSITWIALQARAWNLIRADILDNIFFGIGFGIGNFLWLYSLILIVERFRTKFDNSFFNKIKAFAGYTFIGFGAILGYRVFQVVKIPELLRLFFAF